MRVTPALAVEMAREKMTMIQAAERRIKRKEVFSQKWPPIYCARGYFNI
jgi:hypothetical protein